MRTFLITAPYSIPREIYMSSKLAAEKADLESIEYQILKALETISKQLSDLSYVIRQQK